MSCGSSRFQIAWQDKQQASDSDDGNHELLKTNAFVKHFFAITALSFQS